MIRPIYRYCALLLGLSLPENARADSLSELQPVGFTSTAVEAAPSRPFVEDTWTWTDNLTLFLGLEGSKQPQDVGVNATFGGRGAINFGFPIWKDAALGGQIGTAVTYTDHAVQVMRVIDGNDDRSQVFTTAGVFQRTSNGFEWGLVWDVLNQDYYDHTTLHQFRAQVGLTIGTNHQWGVKGAWSSDSSRETVGGQSVRLRPIDQFSVFWKHLWSTGVETEFWGGIADGHGEVVYVFPGNPSIDTAPLFGAALHVPLGKRLAIYGQGNFILPADSGTVDSYLGFAYYFDDARTSRYSPFAPLFDVAGCTSFAVDLSR